MNLPEPFASLVKQLRENLDRILEIQNTYMAVWEASEGLDVYSAGPNRLLVDFSHTFSVQVSAHLSLRSYADIGTFGKRLRKHGIHLCSQGDQGVARVVTYTHGVTLFACFPHPGSLRKDATCHYVQVGVVERPQYELRCVDA